MKNFFLLIATLCFSVLWQNSLAQIKFSSAQVKKDFITEMKNNYHFDQKEINYWLAKAHRQQKILDLVSHPYEKTTWNIYRNHFIKKDRIQTGVRFWMAHAKTLKFAEKTYGIPVYIIIGILGVETDYGKTPLPYRAIDALKTLAFYYPTRSKFFKSELEQYFLLTREQHISPLKLRSSYAGALGVPQFMPSSYRTYAVHSSKYKYVDLEHHVDDAILSIAHYLNQKGDWRVFHPTATRAILKTKNMSAVKKLISSNPTLKYALSYYRRYRIYPDDKISPKRKTSLIVLRSQHSTEYWFVFHNFGAIMRYNPNIGYAMVVYQLGQAVQKEVNLLKKKNGELRHHANKKNISRTSRTRQNTASTRRPRKGH